MCMQVARLRKYDLIKIKELTCIVHGAVHRPELKTKENPSLPLLLRIVVLA